MTEQEKQLMRDLLEIAKQTVKDCGGCDHSVGICMCGEISVIATAEQLLAEQGKEGEE